MKLSSTVFVRHSGEARISVLAFVLAVVCSLLVIPQRSGDTRNLLLIVPLVVARKAPTARPIPAQAEGLDPS
jgi:hypothetical protein